MQQEVRIKQFELADQDALLSFLRLAYPGEPLKGDPTFWKWHFLENPQVSLDNIPLWIVKSGDQIVGQVASIPVELKVGNEIVRALWIVDFILLPEYRPGGVGIRLLQVTGTYCTVSLALGFNEKATVVNRALRWKFLGNINRYYMLLFPGNATKDISRFALARYLTNFLYTPLRPRLSRLSPAAGGMLREVTRFDSSFDDLWQQASGQWPCSVVRSSRFLEWQFMRQPGKKFEVLGYYIDDCLSGYIVLFFRKTEYGGVPPKVAISDLCYGTRNTQEVIDNLLKGALRLALKRRAGSVVIDVHDERVEQRLRYLGFRRAKAAPPFAVKAVEHQNLVYEKSNWFLTRGDSDVSIFEEPNQ